MQYHLAQVNIARLRGSAGESVMLGMFARLEEMNSVAEKSAGFIWRFRASDATPDASRVFKDLFVPFEPERLFYNMSIWESPEYLRQYVFKTAHAETLLDKSHWIAELDRPHLALWWVPVDHRPTVAESAERLRVVHEKGPTPFAFTFKNCFPKPTD
jgi:Domain of unknown function (DUF3291)